MSGSCLVRGNVCKIKWFLYQIKLGIRIIGIRIIGVKVIGLCERSSLTGSWSEFQSAPEPENTLQLKRVCGVKRK